MKISIRLIISTTIMIALLFSVGGLYMVDNNFNVVYNKMTENYISDHTLALYTVESGIRYALENGKEFNEEIVTAYVQRMIRHGTKQGQVGIYTDESKLLYTNIGEDRIIEKMNFFLHNGDRGEYYYLFEYNQKQYMALATDIDIGDHDFIFVNIYDMSSAFLEKERQLSSWFRLSLVAILVALVGIVIMSFTITHNIKKLIRMSKEIAGGDYSKRTSISSGDEIGELSVNFDRMAESINNHIVCLENEVENREQFVSDFSHEMKTPMTAIMGYSRILLQEGTSEPSRAKAANYIYKECKRLETLSQRLLMMLRLSHDKISFSNICTEWIIERVMEAVEPYQEGVSIDCDIQREVIYGDASLLINMFRNLVENGIHACVERGDVLGEISIVGHKIIKEDKEVYEYIVCDNGIGIKEENISKVKEAFYMGNKSRTRDSGGSGLGLSICDKICLFHNTNLQIQSVYNEGTTISVCLELIKEEEDE